MISKKSIENLYPYESKFIKLGSYNLHYLDEGKGNVILMLHDFPMWSFEFRFLVKEFSATHRVIAIDLMGFGLSDKPPRYDFKLENHIDNIERVVNHLDLADITLVGHGWGCTAGLGFAVRNTHKVKAFSIINATAFSTFRLPLRIRIGRVPWLAGKFDIPLRLYKLECRRAMPSDLAEAYLLPYTEKGAEIPMYKFLEDIPCSPESDSTDTILEIETGLWLFKHYPICIIWGMKDWLFSPGNLKKWMAAYPDAEVHKFDKAGRFIIEDAPIEISNILKNFFSKHNI